MDRPNAEQNATQQSDWLNPFHGARHKAHRLIGTSSRGGKRGTSTVIFCTSSGTGGNFAHTSNCAPALSPFSPLLHTQLPSESVTTKYFFFPFVSSRCTSPRSRRMFINQTISTSFGLRLM